MQDNANVADEDPWESDEEEEEEENDENQEPEPDDVDIPPQSSQGDQLRVELEEAYTKLVTKGCCAKQCIKNLSMDDLYDHILDLRAQSATHREAIIMGILMARR